MVNICVALLAVVVTGLLGALSQPQAQHDVFYVCAGALLAAILPVLAHGVHGVLVNTHLAGMAGGCGAATVVGDSRGLVPQGAAHRGVVTVASTLILVTALGLHESQLPVRGAGGWGLSLACLLPAGTDIVGSALARIGKFGLEALFTVRHWGQLTAPIVTHALVLWTALACILKEEGHFTGATGRCFGGGAGLGGAIDLLLSAACADLAGLVLRDPGLQELVWDSILPDALGAVLLRDTGVFQHDLVRGAEAAF